MNPKRAWSMVKWSLHHRGLVETIRIALTRVTAAAAAPPETDPHPFDKEYGVDTGGLISGGRLATGSKNDSYNSAYYGIAPSRLRAGLDHWINHLASETCQSLTFIDFGCGKGRAILIASERPFRQVIGVELNPGLQKIASHNLQIWQSLGRSVCPVQILCQDVTDFVFPEGPCAVYMYNPFAAAVVDMVIGNIECQFANRPGQLDVLYFKPVAHSTFEEHPGFSLLWSGVLPLSDADRTCDRVSSVDEICNIYRWLGR